MSTQLIDLAIKDLQRYLHTGMPAKVVSWQSDKQTVTVKPMVRFVDHDGTVLEFPELRDVLWQYPKGGGFTLTFPVQAGDECFVSFSERCIDAWWRDGEPTAVMSTRLHDLSDGFAHSGFNSVPNLTPAVLEDAICLRNVAGDAYVKIDSAKVITIDGAHLHVKCTAEFDKAVVMHDTLLVQKAVTMEQTLLVQGLLSANAGIAAQGGGGGGASVTITGSIIVTGNATIGSKSFLGHTHTAQGATAVTTAPN